MKILALDTSTEACSAAVLVDHDLIERYELAPRRHAALILPMIDAVLAEAGLGVRQLDALAFGRGPGGFTGLRIAVGVVQGIAFATDLPVAPVSTLAAIACQAISRRGVSQVAAAIDARMGEVYWGTYTAAGSGVLLSGEECVCRPDQVSITAPGEWFGAGTGWAVYGEILRTHLKVNSWWGDCYPRAADIATLGSLAWLRGEVVGAEQALPVYLRDNVISRTASPPIPDKI